MEESRSLFLGHASPRPYPEPASEVAGTWFHRHHRLANQVASTSAQQLQDRLRLGANHVDELSLIRNYLHHYWCCDVSINDHQRCMFVDGRDPGDPMGFFVLLTKPKIQMKSS